MRDFTKYEVWNKAIDFAVNIYQVSGVFPDEERFGLTSQIRRAVVSISLNIAEGASRSYEEDFKRFIEIAIGSGNEVKNLLILAEKLEFISEKQAGESILTIDGLSRQLNALRNKLK